MSSKKKVMPTGSILIDVVEGLSKLQTHGTGEIPVVRKNRTSDKPEMPERIWAIYMGQGSGTFRTYPNLAPSIEYLRSDLAVEREKVRELVRLHEVFRDLLLKYRFTPGVPDELNAKAEEIDNLQSALFPEGVERLTNGEE